MTWRGRRSRAPSVHGYRLGFRLDLRIDDAGDGQRHGGEDRRQDHRLDHAPLLVAISEERPHRTKSGEEDLDLRHWLYSFLVGTGDGRVEGEPFSASVVGGRVRAVDVPIQKPPRILDTAG